MNVESVRSWLNQVPFRPFVIRLSNGESHEVRHPENLAISRTFVVVSYPDADRFVNVALLKINSIEALQPVAAPDEQ